MAEAVPLGIAASVAERLGSAAFQQLGLTFGVKEEMKKLEQTLSTINAVLVDAEERQEESHTVRNWIQRLQEVVYDADDLLDDYASEELRRKVDGHGKFTGQVLDFFSSSNHIIFRIKLSRRIKKIRGRLDEIAKDALSFNFLERVVVNRRAESRVRETNPFILRSEIIGRHKHKNEVIQLLLQQRDVENVSVVAIVGFGGLGKTTLAQLVYNDEKVKLSFQKTIWVCVSDEFDAEFLVKKILISMMGKEVNGLDMQELQTQLRRNLEGKRYLLVLDDVWSENDHKWSLLKPFLLVGAQGSRILVTTRSKKVSLVMGVKNPYMLKGLSEEESWTLFCRVAFRGEGHLCRPPLEMIGREVLKRCKGVPLAIRTLASVMRSDLRESHWSSIQHNEIWRLPQQDGDILPVLRLSYRYLPNHLRQCFALCSIFPKDFRIPRGMLIRLWLAHGYIQCPSELEDSEDTDQLETLGEQYFDDLLARPFFQDIKEDELGNIISCTMHDLIHDLAESVAGYSCTTVKVKAKAVPERVRHVFFEHGLLHFEAALSSLLQAKTIRTIFFSGWLPEDKAYLGMIISKFKTLRALNLSNLGLKALPNSIGKLVGLRYLDLSGNDEMETLPNSISNLCNLQTLVLSGCKLLKCLSTDIRRLISLRYLINDECWRLTHLPAGIGEITSLRRLSVFIVSSFQNYSLDCALLNELNGLNHLKGGLCLRSLENVRNAAIESTKVNLKEKKYIESLRLEWSSTTGDSESEQVLYSLQPHPNIKKIKVDGYGGLQFPSCISTLTAIVSIQLQNCRRCIYLPPLDELPCLKILHLESLANLEGIYISEGLAIKSGPFISDTWTRTFFPSLKILKIMGCYKLKGWVNKQDALSSEGLTDDLPPFPCLSELEIVNCPILEDIPSFPTVENDLRLRNTSGIPFWQTMGTKLACVSCSYVLSPLSKLKYLSLNKVYGIDRLPPFTDQKLKSLKFLNIVPCSQLEADIYEADADLFFKRRPGIAYDNAEFQTPPKDRRRAVDISPIVHEREMRVPCSGMHEVSTADI